MTTQIDTTKTFTWHRLSFPLWHEPRPSFEALAFVDDILKNTVRTHVRRSGGENGDCTGWLEWRFDISITEGARSALQAAFEEHFGESGRDFCWDGAAVVVQVHDARAIGRHVQ